MIYEVENNNSSRPTQQIHYRETNICSTGKVMSNISYKPKIIHHVRKRALLAPIGPNKTSLHPPMLLEGFFRSKRHAVYTEHASPSVYPPYACDNISA